MPTRRAGEPTDPQAVIDARPDIPTRLTMYRTMLECRLFEERAQDLFFEGLVRGTTHLGIGQEAVAAGFAAVMRHDDWSFCSHRGHNHTLARGVPMAPMFAELFGRAGGLMGGKGGSMHLTSVEHGAMGCYAIVGANLPIALGAAWSAQYRKSGQVAFCFFGDGATNIGAFHETMNMAAIWKAPAVFVCENNQYMEYTAIASMTSVARPAADRASAYGLDPIVVDGNDVCAVYDVAQRAVRRARSGEGPSLIEALTYRHGGHSRADPAKYRPEGELEAWLARDPLALERAGLTDSGVPDEDLERIETEVRDAVLAAAEAARSSPEPEARTLTTQLWTDGSSSWRN